MSFPLLSFVTPIMVKHPLMSWVSYHLSHPLWISSGNSFTICGNLWYQLWYWDLLSSSWVTTKAGFIVKHTWMQLVTYWFFFTLYCLFTIVCYCLWPGRPEDRGKLEAECKKADAVVLTYACDRPETLDHLSSYWLPELRQMGVRCFFTWQCTYFYFLCFWFTESFGSAQVRVPVIIVGCKLDLRSDHQQSLEQMMTPIMQEFREIETCIECSALKQIQVQYLVDFYFTYSELFLCIK